MLKQYTHLISLRVQEYNIVLKQYTQEKTYRVFNGFIQRNIVSQLSLDWSINVQHKVC